MKVQQRMTLEYVAEDGTIFESAQHCKVYEDYMNADKIFLVEVVHETKNKKFFAFPELLFVCRSLDDAYKKIDLLNQESYKDINIIERLID